MSTSHFPGQAGAGWHRGAQRDETFGRGFPSIRRLWDRELDHYPAARARYVYLGLATLAAILLYYEFYVQAAVTPAILRDYGMTFTFFAFMVAAGNGIGALASLGAGLTDRWGRANMVTYGLAITGLLVLFGLPNAPNLWWYAVMYSALTVVEGAMLVAIPALVRDFSPQMRRGSAMAFYAMGPVIGMLTVTEISSNTLNHLTAWQDQFIICGIVGLVFFAIALVGMRELSPGLRDQVMVSEKERILVEARAAGIDVEKMTKSPWHTMAKRDIFIPAIGIAVFLLVYYTLIAFLVPFMSSLFGYTQQRANSLGNWMWLFNAGALIVTGVVSDKLLVRKPIIVVGIVMTAISTTLLATHTTHAGTDYYTFVWILSMLAVGMGIVFTSWLAAFSETIEARNPALTATGLGLWGLSLRFVIAASFVVLPFVVTSMTPLTDHGAQVQAIAAKYPVQVATLTAVDPVTLAQLKANPGNQAALGKALTEISTTLHVTPAVATQRLIAASQLPPADLNYLNTYGTQVTNALKVAPQEWQRWWWACVATAALMIPTVFLLKGKWSPRSARKVEHEHEQMVDMELAKLQQAA